jgi:hypothetical protein
MATLDEAVVLVKEIPVEKSIGSVVNKLPLEGLAIALSFELFIWSITLRNRIAKHNSDQVGTKHNPFTCRSKIADRDISSKAEFDLQRISPSDTALGRLWC